MKPLQEPPEDHPRGDEDPDAISARRAAKIIGRRALIWLVPMALLAVFVTALGIPAWIAIVVVGIAYAFVVLDLDL